MNISYLKDKPEMAQRVWDAMEDVQDVYPYYWWGWDGFLLMVVWV